jgi:hypothetical protein
MTQRNCLAVVVWGYDMKVTLIFVGAAAAVCVPLYYDF